MVKAQPRPQANGVGALRAAFPPNHPPYSNESSTPYADPLSKGYRNWFPLGARGKGAALQQANVKSKVTAMRHREHDCREMYAAFERGSEQLIPILRQCQLQGYRNGALEHSLGLDVSARGTVGLLVNTWACAWRQTLSNA